VLLLDELTPEQTSARARRRGARVRSLTALAAFICGLLLALQTRQTSLDWPGAWFALTCLLSAGALVTRARTTRALLCLAIATFATAWVLVRTAPAEGPLLGQLPSGLDGSIPITVEGLVLDRPELREPPQSFIGIAASTTFRVRAVRAITDDGTTPISGIFRVAAPARASNLVEAGGFLRISGLARGLGPPMNPGERDDRLWRTQGGEIGSIIVPSLDLIEPVANPGMLWRVRSAWVSFRAGARERAETLLGAGTETGAPSRARALLRAVILGQREFTNDAGEDQDAFTRLGLAHLMAISGMHVAIMAWSALLLVRIAASLLARDAGWLEPALVAGLLILYLVIVPPNAPVLRASFMILALLGAETLGRRHDRLAVLAWTALLILLVRPLDALTMGFQLSFALVASLMVLAPRVHEGLYGPRIVTDLPTPDRWWHAPLEWLKGLVSASVTCWLIATPIVIAHTGLVSPLTVATTVVVLPPMMITLFMAYGALIIGAIAPPIADAAEGLVAHLANLTLALVRWIDTIPGTSFTLPRVSTAWAIAACALLALWMWRERLTDRKMWLCAALLLAWLGAEVWSRTRVPEEIPLRIDAFYVGDATCILLRSGDDALLWDCGAASPGAGKRRIPRAVRAMGGWRTPTAVITHPNFDHYNALADAASPLGVRRVLAPPRFFAEASIAQGALAGLTSELASRGIETSPLAAGDSLAFGSCTAEIISPPRGADWPATNDHSIVAHIRVPVAGGVRTVLLTGDIQTSAITRLIETYPSLHADVLEMPHHGAVTDDAYELLATLDPEVVIQSAGRKRAADTRWAPMKRGRRWLTTGAHGAAWVEVRADGSIRAGAMHTDGHAR